MIHVMSYITQASYDAEVDYPSRPGRDLDMVDMASPQVARLTSEPTEAWLQLCRKDVEAELEECELGVDRELDVEHDFLQAWRGRRRFEGSYWDYEHGAVFPTEDGRFRTRPETGVCDTLAKAEERLFYSAVLDRLRPLPEPEPVVPEWRTDGWVTPGRGRTHQVHRCYWGEELMAVMVVQQVEDDRA